MESFDAHVKPVWGKYRVFLHIFLLNREKNATVPVFRGAIGDEAAR